MAIDAFLWGTLGRFTINMPEEEHSLIRLIGHPLKFRLFLLSKLPSAFFSGVKIREASPAHCKVSVPYKWFSRNPFRSTYFACLSMAAEMSTGFLCMLHTHHRKPSVSLLVVKVESEYFKKATSIIFFTCNDGLKIKSAVDQAISSGEPQTCCARSEGVNESGERVAIFMITWSFKTRTLKDKV